MSMKANARKSNYDDGYRVRFVEGEWAYTEGVPCKKTDRFLSPDERRRFAECLKRRGIGKLQ